MRKVLRDFLEADGHRIVEAASGGDAITLVESERFDVVILDKEMPGMNGLEFLSFLHHRDPDLPVIFVTAFGGRDTAEESLRRGAVRYVEKPFRIATIVEIITALTARVA